MYDGTSLRTRLADGLDCLFLSGSSSQYVLVKDTKGNVNVVPSGSLLCIYIRTYSIGEKVFAMAVKNGKNTTHVA